MLAIRQSALGHVRYVLKDGLKWLPLYGWYFSQVIQLCEYLNVICRTTFVTIAPICQPNFCNVDNFFLSAALFSMVESM